jgi:hypothetical protein
MAGVALLLSLCVAALGALGVASPPRFLRVIRRFEGRAGLCAAAAFRVMMGGALVLAAPASRAPEVVRVLGLIIIAAGLITPLFGVERLHRILEWWSRRGPVFMRVWAGVALALGLLLAYAVCR